MHDHQRQRDAEQRAQRKTEQGRRQCHGGMIDEAAWRGRREAEHRIGKRRNHLVRRRQQRPLRTHGALDQVRDGIGRLLPLKTVAHQREVHQQRCDVPDRDQRQHDGEDRRIALDQRMTAQCAGARCGESERVTRHRNAPPEDLCARAARSSKIPASREFRAYGHAQSRNR